MYYLLLDDLDTRVRLIADLRSQGIQAVFHYIPLHSSPAGRRFGRTQRRLSVTQEISERLVRLPLWSGMSESEIDRVADAVLASLAR
jgi:dTDP-4-amino-4,6-dideoxygalactose transaminase